VTEAIRAQLGRKIEDWVFVPPEFPASSMDSQAGLHVVVVDHVVVAGDDFQRSPAAAPSSRPAASRRRVEGSRALLVLLP